MNWAKAKKDCRRIKDLGLKAKVVVHTRCHMDDVRAAVDSGVDGVSMYMATSEALRKHSHGKGVDAVIESAREVIRYASSPGNMCGGDVVWCGVCVCVCVCVSRPFSPPPSLSLDLSTFLLSLSTSLLCACSPCCLPHFSCSFVKEHGLEVRFSCEDTFRSDRSDLLAIYAAVDELGVNRVGLADTVGWGVTINTMP